MTIEEAKREIEKGMRPFLREKIASNIESAETEPGTLRESLLNELVEMGIVTVTGDSEKPYKATPFGMLVALTTDRGRAYLKRTRGIG